MSKLIDELKTEHQVLLSELTAIKDGGITDEKNQERLHGIKTALLNHLKKEDDHLYPALIKAAKGNTSLEFRVQHFASEMDKVAEHALGFFNKYESAAEVSLDFFKDYGRLASTLKQRIKNEEAILYAEYNKHCS